MGFELTTSALQAGLVLYHLSYGDPADRIDRRIPVGALFSLMCHHALGLCTLQLVHQSNSLNEHAFCANFSNSMHPLGMIIK